MPTRSKKVKLPPSSRVSKKIQSGRYYRDKRYDSRRWRKLRAKHLESNPYCVHCLKDNPPRYVLAKVLDHITPVSQGGDFWNIANHQGLCNHHHNKKSGKERHENR